MQALSDFLLDSGFNDPYSNFQQFNDQTMENLREAIRQALDSGELFDQEAQEKYEALSEDQVEELIDQIIQKMQEQNFTTTRRQPRERSGRTRRRARNPGPLRSSPTSPWTSSPRPL